MSLSALRIMLLIVMLSTVAVQMCKAKCKPLNNTITNFRTPTGKQRMHNMDVCTAPSHKTPLISQTIDWESDIYSEARDETRNDVLHLVHMYDDKAMSKRRLCTLESYLRSNPNGKT